jgi:hypothetical protein
MKTKPTMLYTMRDWELTLLCDGRTGISGKVSGHPLYEDGTPVVTSAIACLDGRLVYTASGSVYKLIGAPTPGLRKLFTDHGIQADSSPFGTMYRLVEALRPAGRHQTAPPDTLSAYTNP